MAKYCGNCGARWDDNVRVCGNCGAPFDDVEPYHGPNLILRAKIRKIILWIVMLAVVLAAAYFGYNYYTSHTGSGDVIRQIVDAYRTDDIDDLLDISSSVFDEDQENAEEYFSRCLANTVELFEDYLGYDYKISYKVSDEHILSKRQFNNKLDRLENEYEEFNREDIEEIKAAAITLTAKSGGDTKESVLNISLAKEDGEWKLLEIE